MTQVLPLMQRVLPFGAPIPLALPYCDGLVFTTIAILADSNLLMLLLQINVFTLQPIDHIVVTTHKSNLSP
jgi:hypothetical protein